MRKRSSVFWHIAMASQTWLFPIEWPIWISPSSRRVKRGPLIVLSLLLRTLTRICQRKSRSPSKGRRHRHHALPWTWPDVVSTTTILGAPQSRRTGPQRTHLVWETGWWGNACFLSGQSESHPHSRRSRSLCQLPHSRLRKLCYCQRSYLQGGENGLGQIDRKADATANNLQSRHALWWGCWRKMILQVLECTFKKKKNIDTDENMDG